MPPLVSVSPDIETEISKKLLSVLQQHFLLPIHVEGVSPLARHLHALYLVRLSNEIRLLLKCTSRPTTPLLRREHLMLDTEARALSLLNRDHIPFIPRLLHYDLSGGLLGPSFLIRHRISGSNLKDIHAQLTNQERMAIDRSLGLLAKRIGQHVSGSFGSLGQAANSKGKKCWREAFLLLFEGILRDAEDVFVNIPYGEIRYQVSRKSSALDGVSTPRLVVVNLGQPSHVLVSPESKRFCGVSGFGTAVWGDVYMAQIFEEPSTSVTDGFGSCYPKCQAGRTRQLLYVISLSHQKVGLF